MTGSLNLNVENKDETSVSDNIILFNGLVKAWLPEGFHDMDQDLTELRYPYKKKPEIIKQNDSGEICMTFDLYEKLLAPNQINSAVWNLKKLIRQVYPNNYNIIINHFKTNQGIKGAGFTFIHICGETRQLIEFYILPIHGRFFFGTMCCPEGKMEYWKETSRRVKMLIFEQKISIGGRNII